jgi:hypothetical protein
MIAALVVAVSGHYKLVAAVVTVVGAVPPNPGSLQKFIAPRAAWWERMVGTTKRCIRKVLGKRQVYDEKVNTILASIEAAINSRPLTQDDGVEALTPPHFLHGGRPTTIPTGSEPTLTKSDEGVPTETAGR